MRQKTSLIMSVAIILFSSSSSFADRKDVRNDPVIPNTAHPTYGEAVEELCKKSVFPPRVEIQFQGVGIGAKRDNCICEECQRDGNKWYFTCRARYVGILETPVGKKEAGAERMRVTYENGNLKVDLGGIKGAIDTKSAERILAKAFKGFENGVVQDGNSNSLKVAYAAELGVQQGQQGGSSQRWFLVKTDEKDVYVLKNFRLWRDYAKDNPPSRDMVLDYARSGNKFQVHLQPQVGKDGASGQRWKLVKVDNDEYLIKNFRLWRDHAKEKAPSRNMVLSYDRTKDNKFQLEIQPQSGENGDSSQRWKLVKTDDKDVYLLKNFRLWRDHAKDKPPSRDMVVDYR